MMTDTGKGVKYSEGVSLPIQERVLGFTPGASYLIALCQVAAWNSVQNSILSLGLGTVERWSQLVTAVCHRSWRGKWCDLWQVFLLLLPGYRVLFSKAELLSNGFYSTRNFLGQ